MTTAAQAAAIATSSDQDSTPVAPSAGAGEQPTGPDGLVGGLTKDIIFAMKAKHGSVWSWESEDLNVAVVFKTPPVASQNRYRDQLAKQLGEAERQYCLDCIVWPADARGLLDRYPGIAGVLSTEIEKQAGADRKARVRKI